MGINTDELIERLTDLGNMPHDVCGGQDDIILGVATIKSLKQENDRLKHAPITCLLPYESTDENPLPCPAGCKMDETCRAIYLTKRSACSKSKEMIEIKTERDALRYWVRNAILYLVDYSKNDKTTMHGDEECKTFPVHMLETARDDFGLGDDIEQARKLLDNMNNLAQ